MKFLLKLILFFLIAVLVAEGGLRLTKIFSSYTERNFGYFMDPFEQVYNSHYWLWGPNETMTIENAEFTYTYKTNSMGILDEEVDTNYTGRGLAFLGDSFVMGSGADQDSSMPRQMEALCQLGDTSLYVLNAGIAGSDVFFASRVLQDKLLPVGFERYAICINTSDLYDYAWRGDSKRFLDDGTTKTKQRPYYMTWYRKSHLVRAIMHVILGFDHSFYTKAHMKEIKKEAIISFLEEISNLDELVAAQGSKLTILIHPYPRHYSKHSKSLVRDYSYLLELHHSLQESGVTSIDLSTGFDSLLNAENYLQYSWPMDMHFNSKGYQMFAELVCEALNE